MSIDKDVLILYWPNTGCNADWAVLQRALHDFTSVYNLELLGRKAIQVSVEPALSQLLIKFYPMKECEISAVYLRQDLPTWKERYLERKIVFTGAAQGHAFFYFENIIYDVNLGENKGVTEE